MKLHHLVLQYALRPQLTESYLVFLIDINPKYTHNFGEPIPELMKVGIELRELLAGDEK